MAEQQKNNDTGAMRVFIGLGSNLGDSMENLQEAWEMIGQVEGIECITLSSPYVTAPVDMHSHHWFTNSVGEIATSLQPEELLKQLLDIEAEMGRVRDRQAFGHQDRIIDLDILYYGDVEKDEPELMLPHPHLYDRLFVLSPMAEIAPDFIDCKRGKRVSELESKLKERMQSGTERPQEISRDKWPDAV